MTLQQDDLFARFSGAPTPRERTRTRSGDQGRADAWSKHMRKKMVAKYRADCQPIAHRIYAQKGWVCVDDLRASLTPPEGMEPRAMGVLLLKADGWIVDDYAPSKRGVNNSRRIARFIRAEKAGPG